MADEALVDDVETVVLIASGYEWTCPNCEALNKEIEVNEKVICASCGNVYLVEDVEHARE